MKIEFNIEQLKLLDQAIQQMPYHLAAPLIAHINTEIEKQQKEMDTAVDGNELVFPKTHQQNGL